MIGASEKQTVEFLKWEARGRGYAIWPHPVVPEPLFAPYVGYRSGMPLSNCDDGRKETLLSRSVRRLSERLAPLTDPLRDTVEPEQTPPILVRDDLIELRAELPSKLGLDGPKYSALFGSLGVCAEPIAFELVATSDRIANQFVVHPRDERLALRQLNAFLGEVSFTPAHRILATEWGDAGHPHVAIAEFGLGKEFMVPLDSGSSEPFVGVIGALEEIQLDEIAIFQVIFSPIRCPWAAEIVRSVTHADGSALFVNAPELLAAAKEKTASPLFAAVVRVAARAPQYERSWEIVCNVAGALGTYGSPRGNELVPLKNDDYPRREHELDLLARQTHRSGMILNAEELFGFVHVPSADVRSERLRRKTEKTKAAPAVVRNSGGLVLGLNAHAGVETSVVLTDEARVRHIHAIGASGTGKSTLLFNLIKLDLENGYGLSVLDPHGDLIDRVLGEIPEHRIGDVILLDPGDEEFVVGFNVLAAHSDWEKNLLASDLVAVFRRLSTAWGDQLNSVLTNALLAFMESDRGGTLIDVRRFLLEPGFRTEFLKSVHDPNVLYYWQRAFPALTGNKSVGPVVTRLDTFLSPKALRFMVAQKENKFDFGDIIASGKIFLAKLSEGIIGKENSHLLGSLFVSKIQSAAMARQRQDQSARRYHTLYADEFHNFLTPSLAECLSGVRKYRLGLVLAHQEMRQVERDADVSSALLNAGTRIVFRVNDRDARVLENGFSSFEARDVQNLETFHAVCRVERSDWDFNLRVEQPVNLDEKNPRDRRTAVIDAARLKYAARREDVERTLGRLAEPEVAPSRSESAGLPQTLPSAVQPPVKKADALPAAVSSATKQEVAPVPVPELGKGGVQHKAVQDRIKEEGEKLGFRVAVEQEFSGLGQIDLVLSRDGVSIACEVTVTGTIDYEVGNVSKCIKAGFTRIAVVGVSEDKLGKLASAVANSLGVEKAGFVSYYLPDAFMAALATVTAPTPTAEPITRTRGGRIVKRALVPLSPEEAKAKEEQALKLMAELMKKRKRT